MGARHVPRQQLRDPPRPRDPRRRSHATEGERPQGHAAAPRARRRHRRLPVRARDRTVARQHTAPDLRPRPRARRVGRLPGRDGHGLDDPDVDVQRHGPAGKNHGAIDIGYWVGYAIARSYYNRATDKRAAVRELLLLPDEERLLAESGYNP